MNLSSFGKSRARWAVALALTLSMLAPMAAHAQSQETAQLAVRIQQLEEQLRAVNGQVEGLSFQLTQMQTLIERMTEDNEFRFQALEGGAGGKTDATTQPGGVTPSGALSPAQAPGVVPPLPNDAQIPMTDIPEQGVVPLPGEVEIDPSFDGGATEPMDEIGNSSDPLIGRGQGPANGSLPSGTLRPLNLSFTPGANTAPDPDEQAQFKAAYDAFVARDFAFAEDQFTQYLALYPTSEQAADASTYLGDTLIERGAFDQAAEVLLAGFQRSPQAPRAPDMLLKLGVALAGADERETACRTFVEVSTRYPDQPAAFNQLLANEAIKAQCPPA